MPLSYTEEDAQEIVTTAALMRGESIDFRWKALSLNLDWLGHYDKELANGNPRQFILY